MAMLVLFIALFFMLIVGVPVGFAIGGATMVSMLIVSSYCRKNFFKSPHIL